MDATKIYIELEDSQFIIQADDVGQAIAMLWCRELNGLRNFSDEQLEYVHWSQLAIEPEHYIHCGRRADGRYVHSSCALRWLTGWQMRLAVWCLHDLYGEELVRDFCENGDCDNG